MLRKTYRLLPFLIAFALLAGCNAYADSAVYDILLAVEWYQEKRI